LGAGRECLQFDQPKVHQLGATLGQHHVTGFQVAVDNAAAVPRIQRVGNIDCDAQSFVRRERFTFEASRQGLTLQILHYQEIHAILSTHVMKNTDVGGVADRIWP
jgi:hypothetical protein